MVAPLVVETVDLTRTFRVGGETVHALRGVSLAVARGEMLAIMGPSGSGKSTLLQILGCLDRPTAGAYLLDGEPVAGLGDDALSDVRNRRLGFVFQGFNLLQRTTALENVTLPMLYDRHGRFPDPIAAAREALGQVGLGDRLDHHPNALSGGQQQRVAVARAIVTKPSLLLADEPTGNLDTRTTTEVMALFQSLNDAGMTIIIITHEDEVAAYCKRAVVLRDGRIVEDRVVPQRRASRDLPELS